jgi:UDPglucose 6-dehydrogenase
MACGEPLGAGAKKLMKLGVLGLWHLGTVTAACAAAAGVQTIAVDYDSAIVAKLSRGEPPLFEPGLAQLVAAGLASGALHFTADAAALADADVVWVCYDTPVDDEDRADIEIVMSKIESAFDHLRNGATILLSSQLPVGTIARLERAFSHKTGGRDVRFACSPENLRLGNAIEIFQNPGRIIVGVRDAATRDALTPLLIRFCSKLIFMQVESAEMAKHALNGFLAVSIAFTNELAVICERVGANSTEVEAALRSDPRIGEHAYVRAGAAFAGGTLARDVRFLSALSKSQRLATPLIDSVIPSNQVHRAWSIAQLRHQLAPLAGKTIAVLGLAYKPGTDTVRRSTAIEIVRALIGEGANVRVFDPLVKTLPAEFSALAPLASSPNEAMSGAEAVVIATEWPQFRELTANDFVSAMSGRLVLDPGGFLPQLVGDPRLAIVSIGRAA